MDFAQIIKAGKPVRIALLGFGEAGQVMATELAKVAGVELSVYDVKFDDPDSIPSIAAGRHHLTQHQSASQAVAGAALIISAVTAANDMAAAESVCSAMPKECWYLDINSVSPELKKSAAALIDGAGGRYVEAAVMSPIEPKRLASPILLGGPHAKTFVDSAHAIGFNNVTAFAESVGPASATKMCRSVIIKGMEAIMTEAMLTARQHGVDQYVLNSIGDLLPLPDWPKTARYLISRSLDHGVRRAEEMHEVARTVAQAGIEPLMSRACVTRQEWAPKHRHALKHESLGDMLDAILDSERAAHQAEGTQK